MVLSGIMTMNNTQEKLLYDFLIQSDELFSSEIKTDENKDYRRGYYAGRLHAALAIKSMLNRNNDNLDAMEIKFYE